MKLKYVCKICGFKSDIVRFNAHIRKEHCMSQKEYYDKFLKRKNEGFCKVCGNETFFKSLSRNGYCDYCSKKCAASSKEVSSRRKNTCLEKYGCDNPSKSQKIKNKVKKTNNKRFGADFAILNPDVKKKQENTFMNKYGVKSIFDSKEIRKKIEKTDIKKYGSKSPLSNKKIRKKAEATMIDRYGVANAFHSEELREKSKQTCLDRYGVEYGSQSESFKEKRKETCRERFGCDFAVQSPKVHKKIFKSKRRSGSEIYFQKLLKSNGISFKVEFYVKSTFGHNFDFAIFKKDKLSCLIDIDGELFHGLAQDYDGKHTRPGLDSVRWKIVPKGVKFLVIDSKRLDDGFEELLRILPMKYKTWKKEMIRSIPRNIKDAIPTFPDKRLKLDWNHLTRYDYNKYAFIGKSILLHFCRSHWDNFDWKSIRKTLYKSPCSMHHLLEGLDSFKNPSELREKFRLKYNGISEVIFRKHSPEKMLAICSLGKTYISREKFDKESKQIIKFLNLKAFELD